MTSCHPPTWNGGSTCCVPAGPTSTMSRLGSPAELRPQPRGGGRSRDQIIRHTCANEPEQFSRKVEVRTPLDVVLPRTAAPRVQVAPAMQRPVGPSAVPPPEDRNERQCGDKQHSG